ncbi:MAG: 30S ribosomal protein S1 [Deltaproteobacteria bacterium]|nr:30S ribosomal protein S1 [Deltaproteobacteria bacterium]
MVDQDSTRSRLGRGTSSEAEGWSDGAVEDQHDDFAELLNANESLRDIVVQKDAKTEGTIVSIGQEWIFVDIGAKTEGVIAREDLLDEERNLSVAVGDSLTAYVVSTRDGEIRLSVKMTAAAGEEAFRDAYRAGIPVEGVVKGERKGGYTVSVFGKETFCPYSQMDLRAGGKPEDYINKRFAFRITEYSERGRNVVLSRREILQEDRELQLAQLRQTLEVGDVLEGVVKKLAKFGAFVDIGGAEGLIPLSELSWRRVEDPAEVLQVGQRLNVKVLSIDWGNGRISLSRKQTLDDPWLTVADRFPEGKSVLGRVTRLANFGAFVELEPGVEGLVHISEIGAGRRISHPREALNEGDQVEVRVLSSDPASRRISLEMQKPDAQGSEEYARLNPGDVVQGTVEAVKDYGVFVSLPGGRTGLLHVSEIADGRTGDLRRRFAAGEALDVEVLSVDPDSNKISLSARSLKERREESQFKDFKRSGAGGDSLGTLGDILKDKLRK